MNRAARSFRGFTVVELMMSMAFISILMLAIALTVIQISNIYNKGLTMKSVDQAGRTLSLDMRQTVAQSQPFNIDTALRLQKYPNSNANDPDGGRLCTGTYSYVWNFGKAMDNPINEYDSGSDTIRFAKVRDNGGQYCADVSKLVQRQDAVELLSSSDNDLAIQSFQITKLVDDPTIGQALYRIVMEIGTNNQTALEKIDTLNTMCRPPSDASSLQDFCAINQFDFTVQAGNKGGV